MLFGIENSYEPYGGIDDLIGIFDTVNQVIIAQSLKPNCDKYHVYDLKTYTRYELKDFIKEFVKE